MNHDRGAQNPAGGGRPRGQRGRQRDRRRRGQANNPRQEQNAAAAQRGNEIPEAAGPGGRGAQGDHERQHQQREQQQQRKGNQNRQIETRFPISNYKLGQLLLSTPNELVVELQLNPGWQCRLEDLSANNVTDLMPVIQVFRKCIESTNRSTLLEFLRDSFVSFQSQLMGSIAFLVDRPDAAVAAMVYDVLEVTMEIVSILPQFTYAHAKTLMALIKPYSEHLENKLRGKPRTFIELLEDVDKQVELVRAADQLNKKHFGDNRNRVIRGYVVQGKAPDNYQDIDIFPTIKDIEDERPFLRVNKISGPYESGFEYVDTQFRLLREDFVKPIRDGIKHFLSLSAEGRKKGLRNSSVRYYFNVSYRGRIAALTNQVFAFAMQLAPRDYKSVNWERTKRFANGTVIGLTHDNFDSVIFAVVIQRDVEMLKKGVLSIECCRTEDESYMQTGQVYALIESTALFEAYRYNLSVLQTLDTEHLPMEKYIVRVEKEVGPPEILANGRTINLKPIMIDAKNTTTVASNVLNWPTRRLTILDTEQYRAVQSAFQRELCIIQGPPGTGKTFVGLLIIEIMLLNNITTKPILVVCYTNHALDQFLEGILKLSTKIVRVGGMCKNDAVKEYNLAELRMRQREMRDFSPVARNARRIRYRVMQLRKEINMRQEQANQAIRRLIPEHALDGLTWGLFSKSKDVVQWLDVDNRTKQFLQREREEAAQREREEQQEARLRRHLEGRLTKDDEENIKQQEALRKMADEYQSDEEDRDLLNDDSQDKGEAQDERTVIERLLALSERTTTRAQDKYLEFELTATERPRLGEEDALRLQQRLEARGPERLSIDERWDLYRHWHLQYARQLEEDTEHFREEYSEAFRSLKEMEAEIDVAILREANIIGMTTTGAAKYKSLYERLDIEVIVVEEAAELLESHIVTTLSPSTKQLILIGDHAQLRPTTTDYTLATKFHLEISLFERLINNGLPYVRLTLQHRMRPEFTRLIVPHIYPRLESSERVLDYPHIRGMARDLQLVHHTHLEAQDTENRSKSNLFECKFVIGLVKYLLLQGYSPDDITVLAMYSGQQFLIKSGLREGQQGLERVRVTSVDNFQGEENNIIIISFVRSNVDDSIGFLATLNRVCVAFSRARHGLFCIGNFTMIAGKMPKFGAILESVKESVHDHLLVSCKIHDRQTKIRELNDFRIIAEGGCGQLCEWRLDCGHACPRQCHVYDVEHLKIRCVRPCARLHEACQHPCRLRCGVPCGTCTEKVKRVLPDCGHTLEMRCGENIEEAVCSEKCNRLLSCGHRCPRRCGEACATVCHQRIPVDGACSHRVEIICGWRHERQKILEACTEPCGVQMVCDHVCQGTCGSCHQGRLHVPCKSECGKQLICGHVCKQPCSALCPPCTRRCDNACPHSRCERRCGEPCPPCVERCTRECRHQKCTALCSQRCTKDPCTKPCPKRLKCKHPCIGFCTDPCPSKCRQCDGDDNLPDLMLGTEDEDSRYVQLDCGHVIEADGMAAWVNTCLESDEISMGGITCPLCKSPVKKTNRYIQHINAKRTLIEKVKAKAFGSPAENARLMEGLWVDIRNADLNRPEYDRYLPFEIGEAVKYTAYDELLNKLQTQMQAEKSPDQMKIQQWRNLLTIIREVQKCKKKIENIKELSELWKSLVTTLKTAMECRIGQQQLDDMTTELSRYYVAEHLWQELRLDPNKKNMELQRVLTMITSLKRFSDAKAAEIRRVVKDVRSKRGGAILGIDDSERVMILKAMNLKQGHWYTCPNGHVYCITECGGAMVESKCNECQAPIGGGSHRLRPDNQVARAMDGATHAAWSEHYNDMANFDF